VCPNDETLCTDTCVDTLTDPQNCKDCGRVCPDTATCENAKCICPDATTLCDNQCVDTDTDEANCGGCGKTCIGGTCTDGKCICPDAETNCSGTCANLDTDHEHCGACNVACSPAEVCGEPESAGGGTAGAGGTTGDVTHECVCPPDREDCDGVCADLQTDHDHCGSCAVACPGDKICSSADCVCPPGEADCGSGTCANLSNDKDHCGDCDTACPSNQICKNKNCGCATGFNLCGNDCYDFQNDDNHCGSCGNACSGQQQCSGGECLRSPCDKLCSNPSAFVLDATGYRAEHIGTGMRCFETTAYHPSATEPRIVTWEMGGRTVRVNGVQIPTNQNVSLESERAGGYCVQVSAGVPDYSGFLLPIVAE